MSASSSAGAGHGWSERLGWVAFAVALVATVGATYQSSDRLWVLQHADFQYLPMLFQDLVRQGGKLDDWALPPAPYLFPDLLMYAALRLFSSGPDGTAIGASVLMATSTAVLVTRLARRVAPATPTAPLQALSLVTAMLVAFAYDWSRQATGFLLLSGHGGQLVMGFLCFVLLGTVSLPRLGAVAVIALLTSASDPLFAMVFALPLSGLVMLGAEPGWARWVKTAVPMGASALGLWVHAHLPTPPLRGSRIDFGRSGDALRAFLSHLSDWDSVPVYLGFLLAVVALVRAWREPARRNALAVLLLTIPCALFGLWLLGAEVVTWSSRYLFQLHLVLVIVAPAGLEVFIKERAFSRATAWGALAASALAALHFAGGLRNIGTVQQRPLSCFDRLAAERVVHRCVASYWLAKPISMLAAKPVTVIQVWPNGVPDWWINTRRHNAEGSEVDCAVFLPSEADDFVGRFGPPSTAVDCEGARIMLYDGAAREALNRQLQPVLHLDVPRRS